MNLNKWAALMFFVLWSLPAPGFVVFAAPALLLCWDAERKTHRGILVPRINGGL